MIAEMVGWNGSAEILISALVDSHWLDRHSEHRLVVHDWHDHAPNFIKGNVHRLGGFVSGGGGVYRGGLKGGAIEAPLEGESHRGGPSNLTKPNQTKSNTLPTESAGEIVDPSPGDPPPKIRKPRKPDLLFDALAVVTGTDPTSGAAHIGRVKKLLLLADPPYSHEEILRMGEPDWQAKETPWVKDRRITLGEVEKYHGRVRMTAPQKPQKTTVIYDELPGVIR
jgi:hypothetical protein